MNLNAEFSERVVIHSPSISWQDSPMKGVKRRMLDRVGDEVARATSIVSYDPGSQFSPHVHTGGEEFIVLEGIFQDEHGDFPAGSYIRNPPESSHTPGSEAGCIIFVKLWQFDLADRTQLRTDMNKVGSVSDASRDGVQVSTLFADDREQVRLEKWKPDSTISINTDGGAELLVLDGQFTEGGDKLDSLSWMRLPVGAEFRAQTGPSGASVWIKTGHLKHAQEEADRLPG